MNKYYAKRQLKYWLGQEEEVATWVTCMFKLIDEGIRVGKFNNFLEGERYYQSFLETKDRVMQKIQERITYYKEKLS